MEDKNPNLIIQSQVNAALRSIKDIANDLETAVDEFVSVIQDRVSNLKIEKTTLIEQISELKVEVKSHQDRVDWYNKYEKELDDRDERIKKSEEIIEEEKKLLTGKKQHLMDWEAQLNDKSRRLNG